MIDEISQEPAGLISCYDQQSPKEDKNKEQSCKNWWETSKSGHFSDSEVLGGTLGSFPNPVLTEGSATQRSRCLCGECLISWEVVVFPLL